MTLACAGVLSARNAIVETIRPETTFRPQSRTVGDLVYCRQPLNEVFKPPHYGNGTCSLGQGGPRNRYATGFFGPVSAGPGTVARTP